MKRILNIFRRRARSTSPSYFSRRDSGVRPFNPGTGYILKAKDLDKIHKAAAFGNVEKVQKLLLLQKAGVNDLDEKRRTPLHLACAHGFPDVVSLLVEKKCKLNRYDNKCQTPLIKAVECQQEECAVILLEHGADTLPMDIYHNTALHYAACGHNIKIAAKLLRYNVEMEAKNKEGLTPLLLAVIENDRDMVDLLLRHGANVNTSDSFDRTPLMIAASCEPRGVVSLLLQYDIDLSHKDKNGQKAEDYAIFTEHSINYLLIESYEKQKKLKQLISSQISSSESASDPKFTFHVPGEVHEDLFEELELDDPDVIYDDASEISCRKKESYRYPEDWTINVNHPCHPLPVMEDHSGSSEFRVTPVQEDEVVGAESDPENAYQVVIPGAKLIPQKQGEPQLPLKVEDASAISCWKKDSYKRPKDFTLNLNHPFQSLPVTKSLSGSTHSTVSSIEEDESVGAGSGPENACRAVIPEAKPVLQKQRERKLARKMEVASAMSCRKKDSYRRPKDFTVNLNHPFKSLPVTKSLSESTHSAVSHLQDDESTGAGSGLENLYRAVIPKAKPVPQKQGERELPRKMQDECAISCQKKDSYRRPKDFTLNLNNPHQSLPVSPMLKHEAAGAGSSSENAWRVAIPGAKQVLQKQGKPQLPVIIEGECSESFDKSDLEQGKVQMDANDHDDLIQSSDTATEDYDLPPLNYPITHLKIEDVVLRYDQAVKRKRTRCTLLIRKVKNLENMINGMQKEFSETREMKSQLEHQKAEWNRELGSIRFTLNQEKIKLVTTEMLFQENRKQFRREEEQYSKAVNLNQRLECTLRSLEVELRAVRNHLQQVEVELKDTQRQLLHQQRARALQASILNNLLWKQREKEAVASKTAQTSEAFTLVPESNEKEKYLLDKNQILQDEVAVLKIELDTVKMKHQEKENQYTEDIEILKEKIEELQKKLQMKEETLTKVISQYSGQVNVLTTENEVLNSKLEDAKRNRDRLETEIASYHSRLTSAIHNHEQHDQTSEPNLEQTFQGLQDEWLCLQDRLNHHLCSLRESNGDLSQKLCKSEVKASRLESDLNRVCDSLREKTLTLESTQTELSQAQRKAKKLEHINQLEKEKMDKYIVKHESVQERLAQIQSENMLLQQQLEDAQNKYIVKEKALSDIRGQFKDRLNNVRADTGKQSLMVEERNKELIRECNHLREQIRKYEKEKAERELYTETEKLKQLTELNQSLENRLQRELKRNDELQKDFSGFENLWKTAKNKLREYERVFSSLSPSSKSSSSLSSSPSSPSSSSSSSSDSFTYSCGTLLPTPGTDHLLDIFESFISSSSSSSDSASSSSEEICS